MVRSTSFNGNSEMELADQPFPHHSNWTTTTINQQDLALACDLEWISGPGKAGVMLHCCG